MTRYVINSKIPGDCKFAKTSQSTVTLASNKLLNSGGYSYSETSDGFEPNIKSFCVVWTILSCSLKKKKEGEMEIMFNFIDKENW